MKTSFLKSGVFVCLLCAHGLALPVEQTRLETVLLSRSEDVITPSTIQKQDLVGEFTVIETDLVEDISYDDDDDMNGKTTGEATGVVSLPLFFQNNNPYLRVVERDNCATQTNCSSCTNHSYWCHWCEKDQACHARGSFYGCTIGVSCEKKNDNDDDNDDNKKQRNNTCASHTNCTDCTQSSNLCHWCAHDNACHAVGSVYGCLTGVDCYSNDQCKRTNPEPLPHDEQGQYSVKAFPLVLIIVIFYALIACCATACLCCAGVMKGAFDDLEDLVESDQHRSIIEDHMDQELNPNDDAGLRTTVNTPLLQTGDTVPLQDNAATAISINGESVEVSEGQGGLAGSKENQDGEEQCIEDGGERNEAFVEIIDYQELDRETCDGGDIEIPSTRGRCRAHTMKRMFNACTFCYCLALAIIGGCTFGSIRYFPQMPVYNICNDDVAWRSLIETMASMKVEADFQILASVANPNIIGACINQGAGGSFQYNHSVVGTFDIPPTCVGANSVTDILVLAHFAPQGWQSLNIGREFYRGTLVLEVEAAGTIRIPSLFNFSMHSKLDNIVVHVNQLSDRHYCHCQKWNQSLESTNVSSNTNIVA